MDCLQSPLMMQAISLPLLAMFLGSPQLLLHVFSFCHVYIQHTIMTKAGKRWSYVYTASLALEVQADWMVQSMVLLFLQLHLITTLINHYTLNTVFSQVTGTCRVWSLTCCACTASHVQGMPLWTSWSPNFSLDPQWGPACSGQQQYPQMFHTTKRIVMLYNLLFVTTVFAQSDATLD